MRCSLNKNGETKKKQENEMTKNRAHVGVLGQEHKVEREREKTKKMTS
jgi:hypothetical protein